MKSIVTSLKGLGSCIDFMRKEGSINGAARIKELEQELLRSKRDSQVMSSKIKNLEDAAKKAAKETSEAHRRASSMERATFNLARQVGDLMASMEYPQRPDTSSTVLSDAPATISSVEVALPLFSKWLHEDLVRESNDRSSESVAMALATTQVTFPELAPEHLGMLLPQDDGEDRVDSWRASALSFVNSLKFQSEEASDADS